ncbi:hypothetical protein LY76DRAFT_593538 [Colletotrichum caudatum]|nr:hypothetical protein LY76DRAFT_593538 [Colletotrichum caudatum]
MLRPGKQAPQSGFGARAFPRPPVIRPKRDDDIGHPRIVIFCAPSAALMLAGAGTHTYTYARHAHHRRQQLVPATRGWI